MTSLLQSGCFHCNLDSNKSDISLVSDDADQTSLDNSDTEG